MFANRFTALIDACSLVGVLGRNTLLSLAEVELYRARWSEEILSEVERAICRMFIEAGRDSPGDDAKNQVSRIQTAFPEGVVDDYEMLKTSFEGSLPDQGDVHVLAAAVKCRASIIVTENLKDFPEKVLLDLNLEAITSDEFIANTIDLSQQKAIAAISNMRNRFNRPEITGEELLLLYEKRGFLQTADMLREHVPNL